MRDMKGQNRRKNKTNRLKKSKRPPRNWQGIFHRGLRLILLSGSTFLIISGSFLAISMLFESGYFGVERISIMNLKRLNSEEIVAESDIRGGDNIFKLNLEMISKKIEENPWVARAEIERIFPREVVIRVTEREERAIINLNYLYSTKIFDNILIKLVLISEKSNQSIFGHQCFSISSIVSLSFSI